MYTTLMLAFSGCTLLERIKTGAVKNTVAIQSYVQPGLTDTLLSIFVAPIQFEESINSGTHVFREFKNQITRLSQFQWSFAKIESMTEIPPDLKQMSRENIEGHFFNEAKRLGHDAILFCEIKNWRAYKPMRLGVKIELIHIATGDILWWVEDELNLSKTMVERHAKEWYLNLYHTSVHPVLKENAVLLSPEVFLSYAWSMFVKTIYNRTQE